MLAGELARGGWRVHLAPRQQNGCGQSHANADMGFAALAGWLLARQPRRLVLLTGDGDLGATVAWLARRSTPGTAVHVAALPHACSRRLYPSHNPDVAGCGALPRRLLVHRAA
jgi:hypothetical protein